MKTGNSPLKQMQFVQVVSDKKLRDNGIHRGDVLLIAGFKQGQVKASDLHLLREYAVVVKVEKDVVQIPAEDNDYLSYVIDPRNVEWVGEERQKYYEEVIRKQYAS